MKKTNKIAQLGDPILRLLAKEVQFNGSVHWREIVESMLARLYDSNGVGIAAPQIFESLRIVIIASRPSKRYPLAPKMEPIVMLNPFFESCSEKVVKDWEGCLSIPGIRALVPRYENIKIGYTDQQGVQQVLIAEGFVARVFQHEYDHLNGLVYLDRVEDNQNIIAETEFLKQMELKLI